MEQDGQKEVRFCFIMEHRVFTQTNLQTEGMWGGCGWVWVGVGWVWGECGVGVGGCEVGVQGETNPPADPEEGPWGVPPHTREQIVSLLSSQQNLALFS